MSIKPVLNYDEIVKLQQDIFLRVKTFICEVELREAEFSSLCQQHTFLDNMVGIIAHNAMQNNQYSYQWKLRDVEVDLSSVALVNMAILEREEILQKKEALGRYFVGKHREANLLCQDLLRVELLLREAAKASPSYLLSSGGAFGASK